MGKWSILFLSCLLLATGLPAQQKTTLADSALHFFRKRSNVSYCSPQWQIALDSALHIDSTVGTLWQWKGMPYFKNGDYAEAFRCYEKAVHYDPVNYLPLRAFMKAMFLKDYEGAIADFLVCKEKHYGVGLMDHSYDFFLALCYKETGDLDKAESFLSASVNERIKTVGANWVHWNEWYYMGIIAFEKQRYKAALEYFGKSLEDYRTYPCGLYYKAMCLVRLGEKEDARSFFLSAIEQANKGMRSSEDSDIYVNYPDIIYVADIEAMMATVYNDR